MRYAMLLIAALALLPACRIGGGFDTAEKQSNLMWDDTPQVKTEQVSDKPAKPEELPPEALQSPPIVYLLVAGWVWWEWTEGVQVVLRRRFGAQVQTSMDSQVVWFEWPRETAIDLPGIYQAVIDGGMGLQSLHLLGEFDFGDGWVQLKGEFSPRLEYGGRNPGDGKWDIEVVGFQKGETPKVYRITEFQQPEIYQN